MGETIYHLTTATALASHREGALYRPPSLEIEGFVHCSGDRPVTLGVAQSYFGRAGEPVWVLVLEVERLGAEVRWEAPAPLAAGPQAHHREGLRFPHVYGPIPLGAIAAAGRLGGGGGAPFTWPAEFVSLDELGLGEGG